MKTEKFFEEFKILFDSCVVLAAKKNGDYATGDDAFRNFRASVSIGVSPERAILVRLSDKIARISNLLDKEAEVKDEKIEDTLKDSINYLAILYLYLKYGKTK